MATEKDTNEAEAGRQTARDELVFLNPKTVKVGWRARKDEGDISELAESIKRIGQLHPIIVRKNKDGSPVIIAGLRRLRACRSLGVEVKATFIRPEDELSALAVQLEENVKRKDFDKLEVGEGLKRYKALFEKKHGLGSGWNLKAAVRGSSKAKKGGDVTGNDFILEASRALGIGKSSIYDLLGVADLPEEDKKEIVEAKTTRERNVAASKALSKVRKDRKLKKLEVEAEKKTKARAKKAAKEAPKGKDKPAVEPVKEEKVFLVMDDYKKMLKSPPRPLRGEVDLCLTDPPYDLERNPILHTARSTINDQSLAKWDRLDIAWVLDIAPLLSEKGSLIAFCPLELIGLYKVVMMRAKLIYRGCIVWHKTNPAPAHRSVYAPSCEAIVWGTKGPKYIFRPWENAGTSDAHNHVDLPVCGGNERLAHPAQKPLELVERLMLRHTVTSSLVFDPFMGTGTTAVACAKHSMRVVGCETEAKFFKMAKTRVAAL